MEITKRAITKIAREVSRFTAREVRNEGVGASEYDMIHAVRKQPGITQAEICRALGLDKAAAARMAANLEKKGYLERRPNPEDGRSQNLFATPAAEKLKFSRAHTEAQFYKWLWQGLEEEELNAFVHTLERVYQRCKEESKADFVHVQAYLAEKAAKAAEEEE